MHGFIESKNKLTIIIPLSVVRSPVYRAIFTPSSCLCLHVCCVCVCVFWCVRRSGKSHFYYCRRPNAFFLLYRNHYISMATNSFFVPFSQRHKSEQSHSSLPESRSSNIIFALFYDCAVGRPHEKLREYRHLETGNTQIEIDCNESVLPLTPHPHIHCCLRRVS